MSSRPGRAGGDVGAGRGQGLRLGGIGTGETTGTRGIDGSGRLGVGPARRSHQGHPSHTDGPGQDHASSTDDPRWRPWHPGPGLRVFAVGHFPPPVHGMAVATAAFTRLLADRCDVVAGDISGNDHRRTGWHLGRLCFGRRVRRTILLQGRRGDSLYLGSDGGGPAVHHYRGGCGASAGSAPLRVPPLLGLGVPPVAADGGGGVGGRPRCDAPLRVCRTGRRVHRPLPHPLPNRGAPDRVRARRRQGFWESHLWTPSGARPT